MDNDTNLERLSLKSIDETIKNLGNINILLCGKTGVGKSTLINAIFGGEYAQTGQGKPVTQTIEKIHKNGSPLVLYDSKGLECKEFKPILKDLEKFLNSKRNTNDIMEQIHIAWICIDENSRRVEEAEKELAKILQKRKIPFIIIITKAITDNGFKDEISKLMETPIEKIIRVRAKEQKVDGTNFTIPTFGLEELVNLTNELIPEGAKNAFAAAQIVNLKYKILKCQAAIGAGAAAAALLGAVPIPFSDCILLIPVQVSMLATISYLFGLKLDKGFLGSLISTVTGCSIATLGGTKLVATLFQFFKIVPGVNIAANIITGSTAAGLTTTIGEIYMGVLSLLTKNGKKPTNDEIIKEFKKRFEEKAKKKK